MEKQVICAEGAPGAIGPYSQAIKAGPFVFVSGQIGIDPATGALVGDDVAAQARRALENLKGILVSAGLGMHAVAKTTVFLADISDYPIVNEVYATYFGGAAPARSAVAVKALPKGALVEIEATALV